MKQFVIICNLLLSLSCYGAIASWYGDLFHGRTTASGYIYNKEELTCAKNDMKFGTVLKVTNRDNNKSVVVVVTDTGSFDRKYGRDIDLSQEAFSRIGYLGKGLLNVDIKVLSTDKTFRYKHKNPQFKYEHYVGGENGKSIRRKRNYFRSLN